MASENKIIAIAGIRKISQFFVILMWYAFCGVSLVIVLLALWTIAFNPLRYSEDSIFYVTALSIALSFSFLAYVFFERVRKTVVVFNRRIEDEIHDTTRRVANIETSAKEFKYRLVKSARSAIRDHEGSSTYAGDQARRFCDQCGGSLGASAQFCGSCGARLQ